MPIRNSLTLMIDLLGDLTNPVAVIIDTFIVLIVANWLWANAFQPAWRAVRGFVKQRDRQEKLNTFADHWASTADVTTDQGRWEILREIADQFKPNHGQSLYDLVQQASRERAEMRDDIKEMKNLIEIHIVDRRNGGRRHTDPHGETEI